MEAFRHLVSYALEKGCTISVFDGGEWEVKRSVDAKAIFSCILSVEEAELLIRDTAGKKLGWARVSAYGLEPDETVIDNSITDFMEEWDAAYEEAV